MLVAHTKTHPIFWGEFIHYAINNINSEGVCIIYCTGIGYKREDIYYAENT